MSRTSTYSFRNVGVFSRLCIKDNLKKVLICSVGVSASPNPVLRIGIAAEKNRAIFILGTEAWLISVIRAAVHE